VVRMAHSVVALSTFVAIFGCSITQTGWHKLAPMPEPRWFHVAAVGGDGRIYAYGGYVEPDPKKSREYGLGQYSLVIYDPRTNTWQRGPEAPEFRYKKVINAYYSSPTEHFTKQEQFEDTTRLPHEMPTGSANSEGRVFWFSSQGPVLFDPKRQVWDQTAFPTVYQEERRLEGMPIYIYRVTNAIATASDGCIYLVGGAGRRSDEDDSPLYLLSSLEIFNPKTNKWTLGAPMHQGRQIFPATFAPDGKMYVFGGFGHLGLIDQKPGESNQAYEKRSKEMDEMARQVLSSVEAYDPKTNTWTPRAPMPVGVEGAGAALGADGKIYVVGGTRSYSSPLPLKLVQVYDPVQDKWSKGPALKTRRQGLAVVATPDGRIYAIGGTSHYSAYHPRMLLGGEPAAMGGPLASVEVLETAPKK